MFKQRYMKLRAFVRRIGFYSSLIKPNRILNILKDYSNLFYSGEIQRILGKCGKNLYVMRSITIFHPERMVIGDDVRIFNNVVMACHTPHSNIIIGNGVLIGESCHISSIKYVEISDDVLLGRRVLISDNSHGNTSKEQLIVPPLDRKLYSKGGVKIGKKVWLGDNVIVLPGVEIGEGCVIGASSIVTKSIPPYSVCVGNPAKIIKTLI